MEGSMKTIIVSVLLALGAGILAGEPAHAQANVALGAPTSPPIGWVQFCQDNAGECVSRTMAPATITLTETSWRRIVKINADVNKEIHAITDQEHWGAPEVWSYPNDGKGDCEDYVLEKRRRLVEAGFPLNALLITVVRDLKGDGHAVLTVKTDRGDFVLDNQVGKIVAWKETGYRFIKRQSDENPMRWVSLGGIDTRTVAAQR
ncbi:MAG: transglutaminase-like cysteine peptidase [Methylobacterium sp.]|nr:transglutaminase-like cysteine peptidase [Methylobacterium sp.]